MILTIGVKENKFVHKIYDSSMQSLKEFFGFELGNNAPNIILVKDRATIDALKKEKTEPWSVGWTDGKNIYVLDKKNYEKESSHKYSRAEYITLIKHELVHSFYDELTDSCHGPPWFSEGVAIYLSGQNKFKTKPAELKEFLDIHTYYEKDIYK